MLRFFFHACIISTFHFSYFKGSMCLENNVRLVKVLHFELRMRNNKDSSFDSKSLYKNNTFILFIAFFVFHFLVIKIFARELKKYNIIQTLIYCFALYL